MACGEPVADSSDRSASHRHARALLELRPRLSRRNGALRSARNLARPPRGADGSLRAFYGRSAREAPRDGGRVPVVGTAERGRPERRCAEEPIAIIGIGCRFPGSDSPRAFWSLLRDGIDAVTEVPASRWDAARHYDRDGSKAGKTNSRWGGFLTEVDRFDSLFFGISPREARHMDPQQRLLLEVAWEAFEDAGQAPASLRGSATGVFLGMTTEDYGRMQWNRPAAIDMYSATGTLNSVAAGRVSYAFDFRGPSLSIDTACSSSLVAIHYACQSLWSGEATLALAGGVNLILTPGERDQSHQARRARRRRQMQRRSTTAPTDSFAVRAPGSSSSSASPRPSRMEIESTPWSEGRP